MRNAEVAEVEPVPGSPRSSGACWSQSWGRLSCRKIALDSQEHTSDLASSARPFVFIAYFVLTLYEESSEWGKESEGTGEAGSCKKRWLGLGQASEF